MTSVAINSHRNFNIQNSFMTSIGKIPVREYQCDYGNCTKKYRTRFSLKRHYLSHLGIKQHQCPHCEKRFRLVQYLNEHIYTHTGERPFVCNYPGCNKRFRQAGKLSIHKKQHNKIAVVSESSDNSSTDFVVPNCTVNTIQAIYAQIAAFQLPSFFYSKVLPIPSKLMASEKDGITLQDKSGSRTATGGT